MYLQLMRMRVLHTCRLNTASHCTMLHYFCSVTASAMAVLQLLQLSASAPVCSAPTCLWHSCFSCCKISDFITHLCCTGAFKPLIEADCFEIACAASAAPSHWPSPAPSSSQGFVTAHCIPLEYFDNTCAHMHMHTQLLCHMCKTQNARKY